MSAEISLIETAKGNGLEPYAYLRHLFTDLSKARNEVLKFLSEAEDNSQTSAIGELVSCFTQSLRCYQVVRISGVYNQA